MRENQTSRTREITAVHQVSYAGSKRWRHSCVRAVRQEHRPANESDTMCRALPSVLRMQQNELALITLYLLIGLRREPKR